MYLVKQVPKLAILLVLGCYLLEFLGIFIIFVVERIIFLHTQDCIDIEVLTVVNDTKRNVGGLAEELHEPLEELCAFR